jgi:hypothetical protein
LATMCRQRNDRAHQCRDQNKTNGEAHPPGSRHSNGMAHGDFGLTMVRW